MKIPYSLIIKAWISLIVFLYSEGIFKNARFCFTLCLLDVMLHVLNTGPHLKFLPPVLVCLPESHWLN